MKRKRIIITLILVLSFCSVINSFAGTLIFKNNTSINKVKIVGISNGRIYVEKKDIKKNYPLKNVKAYYEEDIEIDSAIEKKLTSYRTRLQKLEFAKTGKSKTYKKRSAKIEFSLTVGKSIKGKRIFRQPYIYLYLLTESDGTGDSDNLKDRKVYVYSYPREAKVSLKGYDVSKIMGKVLAANRKIIDYETVSNSFSNYKVTLPLSSLKKRKILGYRVEVYNNHQLSSVAVKKTDAMSRIPDKWWQSNDYK